MAGGVMTFVAGLYAVFALPDCLLRTGLWIATHTVYRVHVEGREDLPDRGGIIFYAPALSRFQQFMILSVLDRQVHFVTLPGPVPGWNRANDALCICRPAPPSKEAILYGFLHSMDDRISHLNVDVKAPRGSRIFSLINVQFSPRKSPAQAAGDSAVAEGIT